MLPYINLVDSMFPPELTVIIPRVVLPSSFPPVVIVSSQQEISESRTIPSSAI